MSKKPKYTKTLKALIGRLKFTKVTQKKVFNAYLDYIERNKMTLRMICQKDLVSTIRHDFSNYRELYLELHVIEKGQDVHRRFRNKVNGIIKQKFDYILKG